MFLLTHTGGAMLGTMAFRCDVTWGHARLSRDIRGIVGTFYP